MLTSQLITSGGLHVTYHGQQRTHKTMGLHTLVGSVYNPPINDDRVTPPGAGMFAMTMLTTTASGDAYSQREIESMCTRAGFRDVTHHSVPNTPQTVTIALN
jgi:hypothetical protein